MAAQSLLAKLGMRLSVTGSDADLALAFPLATNDPSMGAHTDASRIGMYASRVASDELVGTVVMGVAVMSVGTRGLTSNRSGASQSEAFGLRAGNLTMTGARNTLVGYTSGQSLTSGARNTAVGAGSFNTASTTDDCVAVGYRALTAAVGVGSTALGARAGEFMSAGAYNVFIGVDAGDATDISASNRFVAGSATGPIADVFFGNGEVNAAPASYTLHGVGGLGTDVAGAAVNLAGGQGTGTGAGGSVVVRTAAAGTTGTAANALVDRLTVAGDGGVTWTGIATASAPALSPAGSGTIFYDSTLQTFRVSMNGAAYVNLMDGSGTVTSVGLSLPSFITVSGSPVTTSGTLTGTLATQTANTVFAGPTGGGALAPTFRALVAADLPAGTGTVTSVGVTSTDLSVSGSPITTSGSITLNVNNGAITLAKMANLAANSIIGNNTGAGATPLALSGTQVTAMLDTFTSGLKGLAPASGGGTSNFLRADGTWAAPGGGTIGGSIAANQVAFGSGVNSIQGDNKIQFTTASGLVVNLASSGADNLTIGSTAGNSLSSGTQNTLLGTNAGTALTTTSNSTAVGYNALAASTVAENTAVGSGAADALTTSLRVVAIGFNALGAGIAGVSDCTAAGFNALLLATGASNTAIGSRAGDAITSGSQNTAVGVDALGAISSLSNSTAVGYQAGISATGGDNVIIGANSGTISTFTEWVCIGSGAGTSATGPQAVVVGFGAQAGGGTGAVAIGRSATVGTGDYGIAIGNGASVSASYAMAFGFSASNSTANTVAFGSQGAGEITSLSFGAGGSSTAPQTSVTLRGTQGSGLNKVGTSLILAGGQGTGSGVAGSVIIQTSPAGGSSSTLQTLTTRLSVANDGGVQWTGIATASAPALSSANSGTIFYDSTLQAFRYSANGAAYANLVGTGTVTSVGVTSTDLSVSGSPVTTSGNITLNVNNGAITLAKMANLAANSIIGNNTGAGATPLALSGTQVTAMLDTFTSVLKGLAPASGGGTSNFLRADGTWAAPAGGIGGSIAANQVAFGSGVNTIQGSATLTYSATAGLALAPTAVATGSQSAFALTGAANTNQTASTEAIDVNFNLARTVQFATGALTTQRAHVVSAPTYAFVGASVITNAATMAVSGAPVAGTNATITNAYSIWSQSGTSRFDGRIQAVLGTPTLGLTTGVITTSRDTDGYVLVVECPNMTGTPAFGIQNIPLSTDLNTGKGFELKVTAEGFGRAMFYSDGKYAVGPGSSTRDTVLSRSGTSTFRVSSDGASAANGGGFEIMGRLAVGGALVAGVQESITQAVATSGSPSVLVANGAAHTTLTASTEASDVNFNLARTVQFATGALATQRAVRISAPTYSFVGASVITNAATLAVSGAPVAGTNATISTSYALWVQSGLLGTAASTTTVAGFRLPHGAAPSAPVDGDVWTTTTGLFARINGGTVGPYGTGSVTSVGVTSTDLSVSGSPVTTSGNITLNVNNGAITLAKMANLAANSIIGNNTGAGATPLALSGTQVTAMLDTFTSGLKGLAPASGGGTSNFLRADGTWAAPGGTGTVTSVSVVTANGVSGSVATATTTPAITLTLGDITPNSVTATTTIVTGADPGGSNSLRAPSLAVSSLMDFRGSTVTKQINAYNGGDLELVTRTGGDSVLVYTGNGVLAATFGSTQNFTAVGTVICPAATTSIASLRMPHGTAPSAPVNGDLWTETTGIYARINGSTIGPLAAGGTIAGSIAATQVAYGAGANAIAGAASFTFDDTNVLLDVRDGSTPTALTNVKLQISDNVNSFSQGNTQNTSAGTDASTDWVATSNTGTDTTNFVNMGINSSGWALGTWTINGANDAYVYSGSTGLAVGCAATGQSLKFFTGGTLAANARQTITDTTFVLAPGAQTSGSAVGYTYTGPASTGLTASTEVIDIDFNLARTVQWATGALATQRAHIVRAPTYAFVGASVITTAATLCITDGPVAGTNATITNRHAILIQGTGSIATPLGTATIPSYTFAGDNNTGMYATGADSIGLSTGGTVRFTLSTSTMTTTLPLRGQNGTAGAPAVSFSGDTNCGMYNAGADAIGFAGNGVEIARIQTTSTQTSGNLNVAPAVVTSGAACAFRVVTPANTNQTLSTEASAYIFNSTASRQWATGALTTQREMQIIAPTYAFVGASTITNAATVAITNAPIAGTNATITNAYALWVQAGRAQFGGAVLSNLATGGMGYSTGAGGAVTQSTSKATGVTLNTVCGQITMNNAALGATTSVTFTLTNSTIAATDVVNVTIASGATVASYTVQVDATAAGSCQITLRNYTGGSLSEAVVLNFAVQKSVAA